MTDPSMPAPEARCPECHGLSVTTTTCWRCDGEGRVPAMSDPPSPTGDGAGHEATVARFERDVVELPLGHSTVAMVSCPTGAWVRHRDIATALRDLTTLRAENARLAQLLAAYDDQYKRRTLYDSRIIVDIRAENAALRQRVATLEAAIRWALGEEGTFSEEPPPLAGKYRQRYWWRTELRQRAALAETPAPNSEGD